MLPAIALKPLILLRLCGSANVITAEVFVVDAAVISIPKACVLLNTSRLSLVILLFRSLVTTSPIGDLLANETAAGGLSRSLSLSNCG